MISGIQFYPFSKQTSYIDYTIMAQLKELGLQPTDSRQGDLAAIQEAKSGNTGSTEKTDKANKSSTLMQPQQQQGINATPPPWAGIMDALGVNPGGSKEVDAANISAVIATMEPSEAKAIAASCQALGLNVSIKNEETVDPSAGQDYLARLNKYFLLG